MRALCVLLILGAFSAFAQDLPDSGLPDGSVGQGGAERDNEEGDTEGTPCLESRSCDRALECVDGRCVPKRVTNLGCSAVEPLALSVVIVGVGLMRRRRR